MSNSNNMAINSHWLNLMAMTELAKQAKKNYDMAVKERNEAIKNYFKVDQEATATKVARELGISQTTVTVALSSISSHEYFNKKVRIKRGKND